MNATSKLTVDIEDLKGFSASEKEKFLKAIKLCEKVINSKEFEQKITNYQWTSGGVNYNSFKNSEGLSNIEIFEKFKTGSDKFNKEADGDIDVYSTLYYSWKSTIGYTYPNTYKTWINKKFFNKFNEAEIIGNVIHEYMHNVGFGHAAKNNSTRQHTVPYAYGYIARDVAKGMLEDISVGGNPDSTPPIDAPVQRKKVCSGWWIFKKCRWVVVD